MVAAVCNKTYGVGVVRWHMTRDAAADEICITRSEQTGAVEVQLDHRRTTVDFVSCINSTLTPNELGNLSRIRVASRAYYLRGDYPCCGTGC